MVRIIDADALSETLGISKRGCDYCNHQYDAFYCDGRFADACLAIEEAPTVDAIPVEWIRDTKVLAKAVGIEQYELFLETLLSDWEEERKEK